MSKTTNRRQRKRQVQATTTQGTKGVAAKKRNQPQTAEELYDLGNCCIERKEYEKALGYYEQALKANPAHSSAHFMVAQIHQRSYDTQKALEYWRKYRCLAADDKSEPDEDMEHAIRCIRILEYRIRKFPRG